MAKFTRDQYIQRSKKAVLGFMFFVSGFCALLYQTIWLRLAFAKFGVITPVVSLVVAVFMLGLGIGSWGGGVYANRLKRYVGGSAITLYGLSECFIGTGAFFIPKLFNYGAYLCSGAGETNSWSYLLNSALVITFTILPFAIAMGATYPIILAFLDEEREEKDPRYFGALYTANTAGAWLGVVVTVFFLVELLGFNRTLFIGACCNFLIGLLAIIWGCKTRQQISEPDLSTSLNKSINISFKKSRALLILFMTGFCSMAMEVVWTRSFAPVMGTLVYSFALFLSTYLISNWAGACLYRLSAKRGKMLTPDVLIALTALFSLLPLLSCNPSYFHFMESSEDFFVIRIFYILASIMPFSALLGYLTPFLVDELSAGDPTEAGRAYAINIFGCILGPLLAGYLILPSIGARLALSLFIMPLLILVLTGKYSKGPLPALKVSTLAAGVFVLGNSFFWLSWEEGGGLKSNVSNVIIHRDYAATSISLQLPDKQRMLMVNGQGMTFLSPITKFMAHLPLAFHQDKSKSVLVICFGMGTTFRSALSWDCKVTVVELVPGVVSAFSYYYPDAQVALNNPNGRIVIDDGRRFLQRTNEKFDVVIVDPPPPLQASSSGLLYSEEFFKVIKQHLKPGGILQQWFGFIEQKDCMRGMLRSLIKVFPYVDMYVAIDDPHISGYHFLASDSPIPPLNGEEFYARLPEKAKKDLMESLTTANGKEELRQQIDQLFSRKMSIETALAFQEKPIVITDDYPMNEYFLLRTMTGKQVFF